MNPANQIQARRQARLLMSRQIRDLSAESKKRHLNRVEIIAETIWCRWQIGIWRWQVKHVRWYLQVHMAKSAPNTRYQHFLTARRMYAALGQSHWDRLLRGTWTRPK